MKMNEARAPDDETNWEAIDIFLFSNGQQYSPPRKYHLRSEELSYWENTLSLLARSQYGSLHSSINLYTIKGERIYTPMDLSNGSAYVAVVPPDPFIHAGYEKYLLKASKSWEKRQTRKSGSGSNDDQNLKQGEIEITSDHSKSGVSKDVVNIITADQNIIIKTINSTKTEDQKEKRDKTPRISKLYAQKSIIGNTERRRSTPPVPQSTRTSILRKLNANPITPVTNKRPLAAGKRESFGKGKSKGAPQKLDNANMKATESIKTTKSKIINSIKTAERAPINTIPQSNQEIKEIRISTLTVPRNKGQSTDNGQVDYVIEDKDVLVVSNLYRNTEDEVGSTLADVGTPLLVKNTIRRISRRPTPFPTPKDSIKPFIEELQRPYQGPLALTYQAELRSRSSSKIILGQDVSSQHSQTAPTSDRLTEDNILAFVNKGDYVHLKLDIEVNNGKGVVKTVHKVILNKSNSLNDVKKAKYSNMNNNHEMLAQSKSLDSILETDHVCCQKNPKVVVIRCPCCNEMKREHVSRNDTKSVEGEKDPKTYFIIIPVVTNADKNSCNCKVEESAKSTSEKGVQNTESLTKISIINNSNKEVVVSLPLVESANTSTKYDDGPTSTKASIVSKTEQECVLTNHEVAIIGGENPPKYIIATQILPKVEEALKVDKVAEIRDDLKSLSRNFRDVSTQTEWCSVLLEVRRHEDGHYTFHLPTLQMIKSFHL